MDATSRLPHDSDGKRLIWIRPLDALEARPLAGTDGAYRPFWSPDSRFIGVLAGGQDEESRHRRRPAADDLRRRHPGADGSWSPDGVILFDGRAQDPICAGIGGRRRQSAIRVSETAKRKGSPGPAGRSSCPTAITSSYTVSDPGTPNDMTLMVGRSRRKDQQDPVQDHDQGAVCGAGVFAVRA